MTADAKVGLLLGLVFIAIIAFVINGLPDFVGSVREKAVVETAVTTQTGNNLVIEPAVVDVARSLQERPKPVRYVNPPAETTALEQYAGGAETTPAVQEQQSASSDTTPAVQTVQESPSPVVTEQTEETVQVAQQPAPQIQLQKQPENVEVITIPQKQVSALKYTVEEGDNLAYIARKYYGQEEGNKRATIQMLYEANKDVLESPEILQVGDELVIPRIKTAQVSPQTASESKETPKPTPTVSLLDKFKNVFTSTDKKNEASTQAADKSNTAAKVKSQTTTADKKALVKVEKSQPSAPDKKPAVKAQNSKGITEYTVQSGDYLYKIAAKKLGDGDRYTEILKLNSDILEGSDRLQVGMKLKIPKQ